MQRACFLLALTLIAPFVGGTRAFAQGGDSKPTPDVLIFSNGDQLTGKLVRATGGNVVFKSDMAGELTISFDKIKELRSGSQASQFALLRKGTPSKEAKHAPEGTLAYADGNLTITPASAPAVTAKPADVAYLVDKPTFDKAVNHRAGMLDGWNGTITGGASVVRSSQNGVTLTAATNLVRAIPLVPYFPSRNRTVINAVESYGTLTTVSPPPAPGQLEPTVKTSIFHADAERDEYFSPRLYALVDIAFDHNFALLQQLQQIYGGGIGWTPVKDAKQELDLKGEVHYERQQFMAPEPQTVPPTVAAPSVTLFGSTFGESYRRILPHKIVFTETGSYLPAWTDFSAYSANFAATLAMPVFKRLSASISTNDSYLNDAPVGTQKNSFQLVTGITYTLH
ncbi:MAG TPA: DUF481 domain-containing protein [Acidobacteriaceae bacterium]